jgi:hypothetical protein
VVLPEHADDACCFRILLHQGGKQQRVLPSVVAVEGEAEAVAVEQEIARGVRRVRAIARGLERRQKCETESFVNLEKLPSPCDEPRDVAHATMSVRALMVTALFERNVTTGLRARLQPNRQKCARMRHDGAYGCAGRRHPTSRKKDSMAERKRILSAGVGALVVAGMALAGCASSAGGATSASPSSQTTIEPDPDLGAAWLDSGRMVGLVTLGSSTCVPRVADEAQYTDDTLHVELAAPAADEPCTSDLVPRVTLVDVPKDVDPEKALQIEVTGDEYFGVVELDGVAGLDPAGETDYEPSAGWATTKGQFVILTWGSSTCIPEIQDVAATGPAEVTVTYVTPPSEQVCTMDMVGRGAVTAVNDLEDDSDVVAILTKGGFLGLKVPIYGTN